MLGRVQAEAALRAVRFAQPGHDLRALPGAFWRSLFLQRAEGDHMGFQVQELTLELIGTLKPLVPRIRRHERSLADQLVRAATSIALNLAEGQYSDPGNRKARFYSAAGSVNETRAALQVAIAWGYFPEAEAQPAAGFCSIESSPCCGS